MNASLELSPVAIATMIVAVKRSEKDACAQYATLRAELLSGSWDREPIVVDGGKVVYRGPTSGSVSIDKDELRDEVARAAGCVARAQTRLRAMLAAAADPELAAELLAVSRALDKATVAVPTKQARGASETIAVTV